MENKYIPTVETQMLIRKPINQVFQAFINPEITSNFWFTKSSGILEKGKIIKWEWEMYNASAEVDVKEIVQNKLIKITWGEPATTIDFIFTAVSEASTYVEIKNYGFSESGNDLIEAIKNNTGGFTTVLDGLKAYLEYGIKLNLVGDKFPQINQK
ncbi:MAG: polyketide cyclase [Saprospiraceae bacterium]|nr:polyketide cyclase [Saprospiraceae bacterium]